ncbi:MAG: PD-(D/E)XK nuclease family protein [Flavobacteriales bacterium]|nr:PD-(D/E)XK nuclease family protein [Flavobacteriales bacterium]
MLINKPIWLPQIFGTEQLIEKFSGTIILDNIALLFELYGVYCKNNETPETFDEFSKWGQLLLHDYNEVDRYMVPTNSFFSAINNIKAIETWNLGATELSEIQQNYLNFWKQMGNLYFEFNAHLSSKNYAYQGRAFRTVAEQIIANPEIFIQEKVKWNKLIFVGFNALTIAEETILTQLKKHNKADILWDADEYYLNNSIQESGLFLRTFKQKEIFSPFNWVSNKFTTEKKEIQTIGIPQNIGQAKYLPTIIKSLNSTNQYKDTAIVLADENLLIPVLDSIPEEVENINVTMGYPLKNVPLNNFFELYLSTTLNANRFGKGKHLRYHYKDIIKLFKLSFSEQLFGKNTTEECISKIVGENIIFIEKETLEELNRKLTIPFLEIFHADSLINKFIRCIELGKNHFINEKNSSLELEQLFLFAKLFNQLKQLNIEYNAINEIKTFVQIFKQLLNGTTIELYGEPLQGLQIMGVLETRNIDFKNVILLSVNEGILPAGKTFNSFIPFDVKREFNLPTHVEKDAVYAYHFYRLIQNAENIFLLYNTETNEFGSGEKSRFITQIENELKNFSNISIQNKIVSYPNTTTKANKIQITKTKEVSKKIDEFFKNGISPTALNNYLSCPLDFYYNFILRVREEDKIEETVEDSTFGLVIHEVLEKLFNPHTVENKTLKKEDVKNMKIQVHELVKQAFIKRNYRERELKAGKNKIAFVTAVNFIETFLLSEYNSLDNSNSTIQIKSLEKTLKIKLALNEKIILLKGNADRIDVYNKNIRVVDYKTGSVDKNDLKIESVAEVLEKPKAFQVLYYAYLYAKEHQLVNEVLTSGIISLKKPSNGFMPLLINNNETITPTILAEFEVLLLHLLTEIANPELVFEHNDEASYCLYC